MILVFYHALFTLAYPFLLLFHLPGLLWGGTEGRTRAREKLGWFTPRPATVWIHAVSGGEALLTRTLMDLLGGETYFLTTQSPTGMETLRKVHGADPSVQIAWFPFDFWPLMFPLLKRGGFRKLVIIEHDLWPGMIHHCRRLGIATYLVNAAFKPRDLAWLRRFPFLVPLLYGVDHIAAQNPLEAQTARGTRGWTQSLHTPGNLKLRPIPAQEPLFHSPDRPRVVFGSSHPPEEEIILSALASHFPKILLVIVPRHPDRCPALFQALSPRFRTALLSRMPQTDPVVVGDGIDVVLVDRMGVLLRCYAGAEISLVGDTFRPSQGGHNFLEPLSQSVPVIYGSEMKGFRDLTPFFEELGAAKRTPLSLLPEVLATWLNDPAESRKRGSLGRTHLARFQLDPEAMTRFLRLPHPTHP